MDNCCTFSLDNPDRCIKSERSIKPLLLLLLLLFDEEAEPSWIFVGVVVERVGGVGRLNAKEPSFPFNLYNRIIII